MNLWLFAHLWISVPLCFAGAVAGFIVFGPYVYGWRRLASRYATHSSMPNRSLAVKMDIRRLVLGRFPFRVSVAVDSSHMYLESRLPGHARLAIPWSDITASPRKPDFPFFQKLVALGKWKSVAVAFSKDDLEQILKMRDER